LLPSRWDTVHSAWATVIMVVNIAAGYAIGRVIAAGVA